MMLLTILNIYFQSIPSLSTLQKTPNDMIIQKLAVHSHA